MSINYAQINRNLLNDPVKTSLARELYAHPPIKGLYKDKLPSYIPSRTFALALMDMAGLDGASAAVNPLRELAARSRFPGTVGRTEE
jgi:hypothetical protein